MKSTSILLSDPKYPYLLRNIFDPPRALHIWGALPDFEEHPPIAVVGSRKPTEYGRGKACEVSAGLARAGLAVVSGLAYGIDSTAHRACVKEGGLTIAVLGGGLDKLYPAVHKRLAEEIVAAGGAVITEFDKGTPPLAHHFPARNRIISGLSLGVVIVEAAIDSGSLGTAKHALEQGREVFAMPGPAGHVNTAGTHKLLREGAALVEAAQDVIDVLENRLPKRWREKMAGQVSYSSDKGEKILGLLGRKPVEIDKLVASSGLGAGETSALLTMLECGGLVKQLPGRRYIRLKTHD